MDAPRELRAAANEDETILITRREYDGENIIAIDFGSHIDADLDIVGETAIVVVGDRQYEFEVPPDATEIAVNDGILLIKG